MVSAGARGAYAVSAGPDRLAVAGAALSSVRSRWSSTAEWVPAAEPRLVVSTTGAGDTATGLLYGLAQGTGIRRATRLASRFAASAIEGGNPRRRRPAAGLPSWPQQAWTDTMVARASNQTCSPI